MAITAIFRIPGMTAEQYDESIKALAAAGFKAPDGRMYHAAHAIDGGWLVIDVWQSLEKLRAFSDTLIPILTGAGVTPAEPEIYPVHNQIIG